MLLSSCAAAVGPESDLETESSAPAVEIPPPGSAPTASASFGIIQDYQGLHTEWNANVDALDISVSSEDWGGEVAITAVLSGHAVLSLQGATHGSSVDQKLNTTPYWPKDSLVCQYGITGQSLDGLAAIGLQSAAMSAEAWKDYSVMPYCGFNWTGYNLNGPNDTVDIGSSVELVGDEFSFTILASPDLAAQISSELLAPAGWMFSYPHIETGCATFGSGYIIYATTDVCS